MIRDSSSEVSVSAGQSALLQCHVTGDPRPQVTWTKNGVRLSSLSDPHYFITETGSLEIFSAHPDDTATYSCTAINVAGVREKRFMLFVHGQRPHTYTLCTSTQVYTAIRLSVCHVDYRLATEGV